MPLLPDRPAPLALDAVRAEFRHLPARVFFNHAAVGVYSRRVASAAEGWVAERSGDCIENYLETMPRSEDALERLGALLGVPRSAVEFVASTSDALSILAEGLDWQPGDRVVVPACEFPANVYPFLNLRRKGVEVDFVPHENGCVSLGAVAAAITPRTRLVSVSWVQFLSGHRLDVAALAEIVHDRGALLCVDAIQGLGALRLDVGASGIDFLACGVQKWWMGPQGLAFLYCAPHLSGHLNGRAGWLHGPVDWDNFLDYDLAFFPDARRFRIGTLNALGAMLFRAALSLYEDAGPDACHARVLSYGRQLRDGLHALGQPIYGPQESDETATSVVTFVPTDPDAVFAALTADGIATSMRNRMIRVSPSWENTPEEVDRALGVIARTVAGRVTTGG